MEIRFNKGTIPRVGNYTVLTLYVSAENDYTTKYYTFSLLKPIKRILKPYRMVLRFSRRGHQSYLYSSYIVIHHECSQTVRSEEK